MMETDDTATTDASAARRRVPRRPEDDSAGWAGRDENGDWPADGYRGRHSASGTGEPPVARRTATGWRVGDEEVSDLTSAMVLADLLAADLPPEGPPTPGSPAAAGRGPYHPTEQVDVGQLQETIAQLEHALAVRVRVEQAIGVLAERHRLRPREAFDLLRKASRSRGARVTELAQDVVASTANPLLQLPEELSRALPEPRQRGNRSLRRTRLLAVAIAVPAGRLRP
jgi:ANTAR domain